MSTPRGYIMLLGWFLGGLWLLLLSWVPVWLCSVQTPAWFFVLAIGSFALNMALYLRAFVSPCPLRNYSSMQSLFQEIARAALKAGVDMEITYYKKGGQHIRLYTPVAEEPGKVTQVWK